MSEFTSARPTRTKHSNGFLFGRIVNFIERQRPVDAFLLRLFFFVCLGSLIIAAIILNNRFTSPTPVTGGTLTEGVVGIPRFINPVLAVTRADQDLVALTFRGLMKISPDGTLIPDIAESVTPSSDGTIYNVVVRQDIRFHDDTPLTARDVIFTIGLIQNPDLKSPLRGNWAGVLIEEINEYEFNIILTEAYAPFIENLTFGILPRHIWNDLPIEQIPFSQRNTEPVGAGPFQIENIIRDPSGFITSYELTQFLGYHEESMLGGIDVKFYSSEEMLITALKNEEIDSTVYAPLTNLKDISNYNYSIISEPLPRIFGVFINQNRSVALRDTAARQALGVAIDRDALIADVLYGYGVPTKNPVPSPHHALESTSSSSATSTATSEAEAILIEGGWRRNSENKWEKRIDEELQILSFTLRTTNNSVFEQTAEHLQRVWGNLGIDVFIEQYEQSDLLQSVIRPRDFEGVLFGLDMNRSVDLYPFWHSSQREDPGLNIAQYASITADDLLTEVRTTLEKSERDILVQDIINEIGQDAPAIFLFSPNVTYVVKDGIEISPIKDISRPHERFMNINTWHMSNDDLWKVFQ